MFETLKMHAADVIKRHEADKTRRAEEARQRSAWFEGEKSEFYRIIEEISNLPVDVYYEGKPLSLKEASDSEGLYAVSLAGIDFIVSRDRMDIRTSIWEPVYSFSMLINSIENELLKRVEFRIKGEK